MTNDIYTKGKYLENNPNWHVEDSPWKADQIIKIMKKNKLHSSSICEVGCGAGEILSQLLAKMPDDVSFVGCDISPQAIELCKQKERDRLKFYLGEFPPIADNFDVILAIDVIEHIENYYDFLREIRKRGEHKVFHIPLDISAQSVLRASPLIKQRQAVGHIHYFIKETVLAALSDAGYEIKDYFYTGAAVDRPARSFASNIVRLLRKMLFFINPDLSVRLLGGYSLMVLAK